MFQKWISKLTRCSLSTRTLHPLRDRQRRFECLEARMVMSATVGVAPGDVFLSSELGQNLGSFVQVNGSSPIGSPAYVALKELRQAIPAAELGPFSDLSSILSPDLHGLRSHSANFSTLDENRDLGAAGQHITIVVAEASHRGFHATTNLVMLEPIGNFATILESGFKRHPSMTPPLAATASAGELSRGLAAELPIAARLEVGGNAGAPMAAAGSHVYSIGALPESPSPVASMIPLSHEVNTTSSPITNSAIHEQTVTSSNFTLPLLNSRSRSEHFAVPSVDQGPALDVAIEGFVDIAAVNENDSTRRQLAEPGRVNQDVNRLLNELHSPPTQSVEPDKQVLEGTDAPTTSHASDLEAEGGMVVLQAAHGRISSELFLLDEAFAELDEFNNVDVRMHSELGAYQAFDVGFSARHSEQPQIEPVSSSAPMTDSSAQDAEPKQPRRTVGVNSQVTAGIVVAAVSAVSVELKSRSKRKQQSVDGVH